MHSDTWENVCTVTVTAIVGISREEFLVVHSYLSDNTVLTVL